MSNITYLSADKLYTTDLAIKSIKASSFDLLLETENGSKILVEDGLTEMVNSKRDIPLLDGTHVSYKTVVGQIIADSDSVNILDSNFIGDVYATSQDSDLASTEEAAGLDQDKLAHVIQKLKESEEEQGSDVSSDGRDKNLDQDIANLPSQADQSEVSELDGEKADLIAQLEALQEKLKEQEKELQEKIKEDEEEAKDESEKQAEAELTAQAKASEDAVKEMQNELQVEEVEENDNTSKLTGEYDEAPSVSSSSSSSSAPEVEEGEPEDETLYELTVSLSNDSDSGKSGDWITNVSEPVFSGTGTPASIVTVSVSGSIYTAIVDDTGSWSLPSLSTLEEGTYTVDVSDSLGGILETKNIVIDQTNTLDVSIKDDTGVSTTDEITNVSKVVYVGTTDEGASVEVSIGGTTYSADADAEGAFTIELTSGLSDGTYDYTVTSTDIAGNVVTQSSTIVIDTSVDVEIALSEDYDTGRSSSDEITKINSGLVLIGQIETTYETITFTFDGTEYDISVDEDGSFSFTVPSSLSDGVYDYSLVATDVAGNEKTISSSITVDTSTYLTGGLDSDSDSGASNSDNLTNQASPTFSGTAEPDSTVTVTIGGAEYTTTANSDGTWSMVVGGTGFDDGDYEYTISSEDVAGNVATEVTGAITIDSVISVSSWISNDSGSSDSDGITNNPNVIVKGETEIGATASIVFNGNTYSLDVDSSDGSFVFETGDLDDGNYSYEIVVEDLAGNTATTGTVKFTVDTTIELTGGLDESSDSGKSSSDGLTNNSTPTFSGTGDADATVSLIINGKTYTTTVDSDGQWSVAVEDELSDGDFDYTISSTDIAGNSTSINGSISIDTTAPNELTMVLDNDSGSDSSDWVTNNSNISLSGASEAGTELSITINGKDYSSKLDSSSDGSWSFDLGSALSDGTYTVVLKSTDAAGNSETTTKELTVDTSIDLSFDLDKSSDTGSSATDTITKDNTPTISGTTDANSTVDLVINGNTYSTTSDSSGAWSINVSDELTDGTYSYSVTATDIAGNSITDTKSVTIDTVAPTDLSLNLDTDTGLSTSDNISNVNTPQFSGTVEAGVSLTVTLTSEDNETLSFSTPDDVVLDSNGNWSLVVSDELEDGDYSVKVVATDTAGNESQENLSLTIDTKVSKFSVELSSDSGADTTDTITNVETPIFSGKGEPDGKVVLEINGNKYSTTVGEDGVWSIEVTDELEHQPDEPYDYKATITDLAGNTETLQGEITVDLSTTVTLELSNTTNSNYVTDNLTNYTQPSFEGEGEAGSSIVLTIDGKEYSATVAENGKWDISTNVELEDGDYSVSVVATDIAGNTATSSLSITIDTVVDISGGLDESSDSAAIDGITNNNTPLFSGTTDANASVELVINNITYTATANSSGVWSISVGDELIDGDYDYTLKATDLAGNTKTISDSITIDTVVANSVLEIDTSSDSATKGDWVTNVNTPVITGQGEPNSTITLQIGSAKYTTSTSEDGTWEISNISAISDGTYTLTLTISDTAGNSKTYSDQKITIDTVDPTFDPVVLVNDTGRDTGDFLTNEKTLSFSGAVESSDITIQLQIGGKVYTSGEDIEIASDGTWTLVTPDEFAENTSGYSYTITYTDLAGNTSSESGKVYIDLSNDISFNLLTSDDSGTYSNDNITNVTKPTFEGETDPDSKVTITIDGDTYSTYSDSNGDFTLTLNNELLDGEYSYTISSEDLAGNIASDTGTITIDTTPSSLSNFSLVNDSGSSDSDFITKNTKPEFEGKIDSTSTLKITITDGSTTLVYRSGTDFTIEEDGTWNLSVSDALVDGEYTVKLESTDIAGNTSSKSIKLTIDTTTTVTGELDASSDTGASKTDGITKDNKPTFSGTGEEGSEVSITIDDEEYTTTVDEDGNWSLDVTGKLTDGEYTAKIVSTDIAGNTATETVSITVDTKAPSLSAVTLDSDSGDQGDFITKVTAPTFSGKAEAGSSIEFTINDVTYSSDDDEITVDENGNWELTITETLNDGNYEFEVIATDTAGNESTSTGTVTIDTVISLTADLATSSDTGTSSSDKLTKDSTPTFKGATDPSSTVVLNINGTNYETVADENGDWSITVTDSLSDSNYTWTATSTDPAGNSTSKSSSITIDTTAPESSITLVSDTGVSSTDNITNNATPVFSGTSEAGSTVQIIFNGVTYGDPTVSILEDGSWSFSSPSTLEDGSHTIILRVTDDAGNVTTNSLTFTVDTEINVEGGLSESSDSGTYDDDGLTNNTIPSFSGSGDAGDTITLEINDKEYTTTVNSDGTWSIDTDETLSDDTYEYTITASDVAGNSKSVKGEVTVDTSAVIDGRLAASSDTGESDSDRYTSDATPTFSGTSEPNAEIILTIDSKSYSFTADENGDWDYTLSDALSDGTYVYSLSITDLAGNNTAVSNSVTIDTVAPEDPETSISNDSGSSSSDGILNSTKPVLVGTIPEDDVTITVTMNGKTYSSDSDSSFTILDNGDWSFTYPNTLEDGVYDYEVSYIDKAGNTSSTASSLEVDTSTTFTVDFDTESDSGVKGDLITNVTKPTLVGTAEPYTSFTLEVNGSTYSFEADENGDWEFTVTDALTNGDYDFELTGTDVAGNSYTKTVAITIDTTTTVNGALDSDSDTGTYSDDQITKDQTLTFSGKGEVDGSITLTINGSEYTGVVDEFGQWSIDVTETLSSGTYEYTVKIEDVAGNTKSFSDEVTIDTTTTIIGDLSASSDSGVSNSDGLTSVTTPTIEGTAEVGSTVVLTLSGISYNLTTDSNGAWSMTVPYNMSEGDYTWSATATDVAGNTATTTGTFTIDTSAALTVELDESSDSGVIGDFITSKQTPSFSGTGDAGSSIDFTLNGKTYSSVVDDNGNWSIETTSALADGEYSYEVSSTDGAGNVATKSGTIEIDTVIVVDGGLDSGSDSGSSYVDNITNDTLPVFSGTGEKGATVELTINGRTYSSTVNSSGEWEIEVTKELTTDKEYSYTIYTEDAAGNSETITDSITIDTQTSVSGSLDAASDSNVSGDEVTNVNTPTLSGSAESGAKVAIKINNKTYTTTADEDGTWEYSLSNQLTDGTYNYTITSEDTAGNTDTTTGTLVVDTTISLTGRLATSSDTGSSSSDGLTKNSNPEFSGTGTSGDSVTLTINGVSYSTTVDTDGQWSVTVSDTLDDGNYSYTIKAVDLAGNTKSVNGSIEVDTAISLTAKLSESSDSNSIDDITNVTQPTFEGTGDAGDTISLSIDGVKYETTVDEDGSWSIKMGYNLSDDIYSYTVTATDDAGNSKKITNTVEIDTVAELTGSLDSDSGVSSSDGYTNASTPTYAGTGEAGATVTVTINSSSYTTTVKDNGTWEVQVTDSLDDGEYEVEISTVDIAGNTKSISDSITIDTNITLTAKLKSSSDTGESNSDKITNDSLPTFEGTGEEGDTITLEINSVTYTTTVNAYNQWSITLDTELDDDTYAYTVTSLDQAGNTTSVTDSITIDTVTSVSGALDSSFDTGRSSSDQITKTNTPFFAGSGEVGATITLTIDGTEYTSTVDTDGYWEISVSSSLDDGNYEYSIEAEDTAGNTKTVTSSIIIDTSSESTQSLSDESDSNLKDGITNVTEPTFEGIAEENSYVTLSINGTDYSTTATEDGSWSITVPSEDSLSDGEYDYDIVFIDIAGNSLTISDSVVIDTKAEATISLSSSSDTGAYDDDNITKTTTPSLSGTNEEGATVTLTINGTTYTTESGLTVSGTSWSFTFPSDVSLAEGENTVTITSTDLAGNSASKSITVTVDNTAPTDLTVELEDASESSSVLTNNNVVEFSGGSEADTFITATMDGVSVSSANFTVNADGTWSYIHDSSLTDGSHTFIVTSTDLAGNSQSISKTITVDTTNTVSVKLLGSDDVGQSSSDGITNVSTPTFTGSTEAGSSVSLVIDGVTYTTTANSSGSWSITVINELDGVSDDSNGVEYSYTVTSTDLAGNEASQTGSITVDTVDPTTPTIVMDSASDSNISTDAITYETNPTFTGTSDVNTTVELTLNGTAYDIEVESDGSWSFTAPTSLADGEYDVTVVATDVAGNTSTETLPITIDTDNNITGSMDADSDTGASSSDGNTSNDTPEFSGTTDAYASVVLTLSRSGFSDVVFTTTADENGNYTFEESDYSDTLNEGSWSAKIVSTDTAGNTATVSQNIVIDQTITLTAELSDAYNSSSTSDTITNYTKPRIVGDVSDTDDEVVVSFYDASDNLVQTVTATVNADGSWYADPSSGLDDGDYTAIAVATDLAGNTITKEVSITVDTTPPSILTADLSSSSDTGTVGDGITQDTSPSFSGTVEVGSTVKITGLTSSTIYANVLEDGTWTAETGEELVDGTYNYTVTATDVAGNTKTLSKTLTVDNTVSLTVGLASGDDTGTSSSDGITKNNQPTIEGTTDAYSTVVITITSTSPEKEITLTADENGNFSTSLGDAWGDDGEIPDGTYTYTVKSTDPAGNTITSNDSITVDTVKPTDLAVELDSTTDSSTKGDWITNDNQPVLKGTVEVGVTLTVKVGDTSYSATIDSDGNWTSAIDELSDGDYDVVVTAVDTAGNVSKETSTLTIDTTPPTNVSGRLDASYDSGSTSSDGVTNLTSNLKFSGTVEVGSTVEITIQGTVYSATVKADGTWSVVPELTYTDGDYTVTIEATDAAGNVNSDESFTFTVDTMPPTLSDIGLLASDDTGSSSTDNITTVTTPTITGNVTTDAVKVWATIDGGDGTVYYANISTDGTWSIQFTPALDDGEYTYNVFATDSAGNETALSGTSFTVDTSNTLNNIGLTSDTDTGTQDDFITSNDAPVFSGVTDVDNWITLYIYDSDKNLVFEESMTATSSTFEISVDSGVLSEGNYSYEVYSSDTAGNYVKKTGSLVIDQTAEVSGDMSSASDTGVTGDNKTKSTTPTFDGVAEDGATITLVINSKTYTTTADSDGEWSITLTDVLTEGDYSYQISSVDVAGNSSDTVTGTITVDTSAPVVAGSIKTDSGASSTDTITKGNDDGYLDWYGTSSDAVKITVTINGQKYTTTPEADGSWEITANSAVADGTYTYTIVAEDDAGNTTTVSKKVTVDTKVDFTATLDSEYDSGTKGDKITNNGLPVFDIATEDSVEFTASISGGGLGSAVSLGSFTADSSGNATVDVSETLSSNLTDGTYTISFSATDLAGNTESKSITFKIDTTPPTLSIESLNGKEITSGIPEISGTAEVGSTITVAISNGDTITTTVDSDGNWAISTSQLSDFADGDYTYVVTASDAAGNTTEESDSFSINTGTYVDGALDKDSDTGKLDSDGVTQDTTPTFSGTAERGAEVTVYILDENGDVVYEETTTSNANGLWEITFEDGLDDGFYTYYAHVDDGTGNTANTESRDLSIDNDITISSVGMQTTNIYTRYNSSENTYYGYATTQYFKGKLANNDANADITITIGDDVYKATTDENGNYSLTVTGLTTGTYDVTVSIEDAAGNTTTDRTFTLVMDNTLEATLSLSNNQSESSSSYAQLVNSAPIWTGTADPVNGSNAYVTLTGSSGTYTVKIYASDYNEDGTFTIDFSDSGVPDGSYSWVSFIYEKSGVYKYTRGAITIDTTNELLLISDLEKTEDEDGNWVSTEIIGYAESGATIVLTIDGKEYTATASSSGKWSLDVDVTAEGGYEIEIESTDTAKNTLLYSDDNDTTLTIEFIDSITVDVEDGSALSQDNGVFSGSADEGLALVLTLTDSDGNATKKYISANENGNWEVDLSELSDGDYSYTITGTNEWDSKTIEGEITLDSTASTISDVTFENDDNSDGVVSDTTPTITFTLSSDTVSATVTVNGVTYVSGTDFEISSDPISITVSDELTDGDHSFVISAYDEAGNKATTTKVVTIDTVAEGDGGIAEDSNSGSTSDYITNNTSPTFSGNAESGSVVVLTINGNNYTTTADSNGDWSVSITETLSEGSYAYTITSTDSTGNTDQIAGNTITIDTSVGESTVGLEDSGSDDYYVTNNTTPTFSGVSEAGGTVQISINGKTYSSVVEEDGTWSVTVTDPLDDNVYSYAVSVTDVADNYKQLTGGNITIDTTITATSSLEIDDGVVKTENPEFSGTGTSGDTISVTVDGITETTTVGNDGKWELSFSNTLSDGTYDYTVVSEDDAGNSYLADSGELTKDSAQEVSVYNATPSFEGTGEVGSIITLTVDGVEYTTTTDENGDWSVSVSEDNGLVDGEHSFTLTETVDSETINIAYGSLDVDTSEYEVVDTDSSDSALYSLDSTPTIEGTVDANTSVEIVVGDDTYTTTSNADGEWSVTVSEPLPSGTYTYTVSTVSDSESTEVESGTIEVSPHISPSEVSSDGIVSDSDQSAEVAASGGSSELEEI